MATLCKPSVILPDYVVTQDQMIELMERFYADNPNLERVVKMVRNTQIDKRHFVRPLEESIVHQGFEEQNNIYAREAKKLSKQAAQEALENAQLTTDDIDMIIVTSCTGFLMPSLTAYLVNELGLPSTTRQVPIAQLGCAAGSSAINRAHDFCLAYGNVNVLIVSVELCSLCFQPTDGHIGPMLSSALFGDGVSACVMRGLGGTGFKLEANATFGLPNTEHYIAYDVKNTGFHFRLDKEILNSIEPTTPAMKGFVNQQGENISKLDFYIFHTGGRKILNEIVKNLSIDEQLINESRASLAESGNLASVVVFDVLKRTFENNRPKHNDKGFLAAFGPGFIAEMSIGSWSEA
ncbi:type III polyketide synthase [Mastigocoleus testarum]|uniref:Polyketide synthase n=1 Tax=Mastigocoleus testarum BC008 TaxID=371196 RepID=A0A0V7ZY43_9CYAN|nr:type III polyketide synthase [Mastigocoleus testarum]KST69432.1 polyketide synthase [Mastigocoleus testarum BC008]